MDLEIESLGKRYGRDTWGLREFTLALRPGVVGLLGPNGAGKSTLMRILATITRPTTGRVAWNGADIVRHPNAVREILGYLPQDFGVYPNLTAPEFLAYLAAARGLDARAARRRIDELLDLVNLNDVRRRPLGGFSGGMRQRVGIAQALLNDPALLVVDEPTGGLDPEERVNFRNLLTDLGGERIVLLSSHVVSDVEAAATRIVLIARGRLVLDTDPETLLRGADGRVWEWTVASGELAGVRGRHRVSGTRRLPDGVRVRAVDERAPHPVAKSVAPTLEDAYLWAMSAAP